MAGIIGLIAFFTVLGLSLLITKIATTALTMTGLSDQSASFQARSAFTGTGFTTREAEQVVTHPVRRKIIMLLMILRSAGLITIVISLILSLAGTVKDIEKIIRLGWLGLGMIILWALTRNRYFDHYLGQLIQKALSRWTDLDTRDYANLLRLAGEYSIMEIQVKEGDWIVGKKLKNCNLKKEGVSVLGITRNDGNYVGIPTGDTDIYPEDTLIFYGRSEILHNLDKRKADLAGDESHDAAVREQEQYMEKQQYQDSLHSRKRRQEHKLP